MGILKVSFLLARKIRLVRIAIEKNKYNFGNIQTYIADLKSI